MYTGMKCRSVLLSVQSFFFLSQCFWYTVHHVETLNSVAYTSIYTHEDNLMQLLRSADVRRKTFLFFFVFLIKVCRRTSEDLSVFVVFLIIIFIIKVCRLRRKTFLFLFCFLFLLFFLSFLFFSTADFLQRFLRYFSTDLDQIWQVHSP